MKKVLLLLLLFVSLTNFAQTINNYQYVIVPIKFDVLKENDRFRMNTTTKFLLQKYGFKSYLSNEEMPAEASNNRCAILYASLVQDNSFFVTKVKVVLKDCQEKVVFETDFGSSREKEYATAYNLALREAFKSFDKLNYKYDSTSSNNAVLVATKEPTSIPTPTTVPVVSENEPKPAMPVSGNAEVFYFAQPTANGFQVIDNEPKVIMRLFNTSQKNVFIADKNGVNGTVLVKEGKWVFEHYENGQLVSETINLKF